MGNSVSVCIKFFSGIDKELKIQNYDPTKGIIITFSPGKRLRWALKTVGLNKLSRYSYFRGGGRISPWAKLNDGDEITCLKPSGGG